MQYLLSTVLLLSVASFQFANGEEEYNVSDVSLTGLDHDAADFESTEGDDDQLEDEAKYRWLAPELFDEIQKRGKGGKGKQNQQTSPASNTTTPTASGSEGEEAEEIRKKKKNKGGKKKDKKNKDKKKNKAARRKSKFKEKEMPLWFTPLGCYKDKGPLAWKNHSLRAIERLYKNNRPNINWLNWELPWQNFTDEVLKCAYAAQAKAYPCFGVQFWGECWGSFNACETYNRYGRSQKCGQGVGFRWVNFVYKAGCGSPYGCCPDNTMPAQGLNYKGCPDCTTAVDVVFIVDSSGSIGLPNFSTAKDAVLNLTRHYSVNDVHARIGIVQYATRSRLIFSLKRSQKQGFARLEKKIRRMRYTKGGTKTGKALEMAYKLLHSSKRKLDRKVLKHDQVVVVLTDGLTNDDDKKRFNDATPALKAVAHVIAVGVAGKGYNAEKQRKQRAELLQIASSPDDVFYERSFEKLKERVDPIARRACPLYYKNPSVWRDSNGAQ